MGPFWSYKTFSTCHFKLFLLSATGYHAVRPWRAPTALMPFRGSSTLLFFSGDYAMEGLLSQQLIPRDDPELPLYPQDKVERSAESLL